MQLNPNELAAIGTVVVVALIMAGYDDQRWFRFFRRRRSRRRAWNQFQSGRPMPSSTHLCERASNEHRIDRPTRSIP